MVYGYDPRRKKRGLSSNVAGQLSQQVQDPLGVIVVRPNSQIESTEQAAGDGLRVGVALIMIKASSDGLNILPDLILRIIHCFGCKIAADGGNNHLRATYWATTCHGGPGTPPWQGKSDPSAEVPVFFVF